MKRAGGNELQLLLQKAAKRKERMKVADEVLTSLAEVSACSPQPAPRLRACSERV